MLIGPSSYFIFGIAKLLSIIHILVEYAVGTLTYYIKWWLILMPQIDVNSQQNNYFLWTFQWLMAMLKIISD